MVYKLTKLPIVKHLHITVKQLKVLQLCRMSSEALQIWSHFFRKLRLM